MSKEFTPPVIMGKMTDLEQLTGHMTDKITEYNYITGCYQFLIQQLQITRAELSKSPGHFKLMSDAENIKKDLKLLEPILKQRQNELNKWVEDQTEGNFSFLKTE